MRPPCELVLREFLPVIRARTAVALRQRGLSQSEIAERLDITQAAVSKYLSHRVAAKETDLGDKALGEKLADIIISGSSSSDQAVKAVCTACMYLRLGSTICARHKQTVPKLKETDCHVCSELLGGREQGLSSRAQVLTDMEAALSVIQQTDGFALVMPQVRANLVACDSGATSEADIAGVPGRITVVDGHAAAYGGPQFGASRHTARVLLWAKGLWPETRSCLCISGRGDIVNAAEEMGFTVYKMREPASNAETIAESATQMVKSMRKRAALPALHVPGGIGVEPILYLFDKGALTLAARCSRICEAIQGDAASRAP
ncbi:MAG: hypothetical protein C4K49_09975 [Candidatus Thorarchaeota archaeon]|nr:MAG: hypothetical protein C4K49_09975 [Candidatus Thorarchaeota archaeon]